MHVFQIKGLSGILMFAIGILATALLAFALPAAFMMVLWNATVFEGLSGPAIHLGQGLLLWLVALVLFKIIFKPEIQFQFKNITQPGDLERYTKDFGKKPDKK